MDDKRGFTLIELIVVIALIALISMFVIPSVSSYFKLSLNSVTREMATTIKEAYNSTVVSGNVNRLVYDMKNNQYWVESGPPTALLETMETKEKNERKRQFNSDSPPPSPFGLNKLVTRKKLTLPRGVTFQDVITQQSNEPIAFGTAYTHFFPHGLVERTIIHLTDDSKHQISLVILPIIGRTEMYERYVTAKEAFEQ